MTNETAICYHCGTEFTPDFDGVVNPYDPDDTYCQSCWEDMLDDCERKPPAWHESYNEYLDTIEDYETNRLLEARDMREAMQEWWGGYA